MELSCKKKAHVSCSCSQCKRGAGSESGQAVHKANEKKLRRLAKNELKKALLEADKDQLQDIDVLRQIGSPYTD
jgi:hypothetical protein